MKIGIKHWNDPKAIIEHSNTMNDICNNINDYNPAKKGNFNCVWWHDVRYYD